MDEREDYIKSELFLTFLSVEVFVAFAWSDSTAARFTI
jgi:hypothetical protein